MVIKQRDVSEIKLQTELFKIGGWTILKLPKDASAKLPSRGMVVVKGMVNGAPFKTPLEPDGKGSHWFRVGKDLLKAAGDTVEVAIEPPDQWPEPDVPLDLRNALAAGRHATYGQT